MNDVNREYTGVLQEMNINGIMDFTTAFTSLMVLFTDTVNDFSVDITSIIKSKV